MEEDIINIRSEKVQEILGQVPGRLIRTGSALVFIFFILLLCGSYFFKYPDIISTSVIILTKNPPVTIVSKSSGNIEKIFIADNQSIKSGEKLAIIENTGNYNDIFILGKIIDSLINDEVLYDTISKTEFNTTLHLGDIQENYFIFLKSYSDYSQFFRLDYYRRKIASYHKEIGKNQLFSNRLSSQLSILQKDIELYIQKYNRDSDLFVKGVIPETQFENTKSQLLMKKIEWENARLNLANNQIRITQIEQNILDNQLLYQQKKDEIRQGLRESFDNLCNQMLLWEYKYLIKSPISGTISFNKFWSDNQNVVTGDKMFTIVPEKNSEIIGKAELPVRGAGKVKQGQKVNIKLANYPYSEYGMVRGMVNTVSLTPEDNNYTVEVSIPHGLITNYGKLLPLNQKMQGTAEIITDDISLLERIFNPLRISYSEHFN